MAPKGQRLGMRASEGKPVKETRGGQGRAGKREERSRTKDRQAGPATRPGGRAGGGRGGGKADRRVSQKPSGRPGQGGGGRERERGQGGQQGEEGEGGGEETRGQRRPVCGGRENSGAHHGPAGWRTAFPRTTEPATSQVHWHYHKDCKGPRCQEGATSGFPTAILGPCPVRCHGGLTP